MNNRFFLDLKYISISFDKLIEKRTGFTSAQLRILGYLMQHEKVVVYQKDIEDSIAVSRAAVSTILDKMERAGLLVRENSSMDKRMKRISLTSKGRAAAIDVYKMMCQIEDDLCSTLNEEEKDTVIRVKNKLINKLEESGC